MGHVVVAGLPQMLHMPIIDMLHRLALRHKINPSKNWRASRSQLVF
jgi:hypothetical protein